MYNMLRFQIWWIRWAVQCGVGFYETWVSIATLINLAIVLAYWADMSVEDASTVSLAVLGFELISWFFLDIFVLDSFGLRYAFPPYIVFVWALSAILDNNYEAGSRNTIFTIVLLVISAVCLVAKVVVMIVRHQRSKRSMKV